MAKTIIAEGRTSTEAIEKGLNELGVSKDRVEIKILENDEKRSFFSILAPRIVKVEMTLKDESNHVKDNKLAEEHKKYQKKEKIHLKPEELEVATKNLTSFLDEFVSKVKNISYNITSDEEYIYVEINGKNAGTFIGYRGDTLNAMQSILTTIANKNLKTKAHIILNIENYREKRKKSLEGLANKLSKTVIKTGKNVTLEPMSAYERKIIHNYLQKNNLVTTYSVGEEPYRKVVISKKNI